MTPHTPVRYGRFSSGHERWPDAPAKQRVGSFADGYAALDASSANGARMRLEDGAADPASVAVVASSLADVEHALRDLSQAIDHAGDALIPPARIGEGASQRYARAAAAWPRAGDAAPPSHERQAQLLAAMHDAGATLRAGADCCRRAQDILTSTIA